MNKRKLGGKVAAIFISSLMFVMGAVPAFACGNVVETDNVGIATIQADGSFPDVTDKTAHAEDVYWLARTGISTGFPNGTFRPSTSVARADMAAFLFRLAVRWKVVSDDWKPQITTAFADVDAETPHAREIWWLAQSGISTGWDVENGKEFRPYSFVARQDMAAFLFRLAKIVSLGNASDSWQPSMYARNMFADVDPENPSNHHSEVWWLAQTGVSEGWLVDAVDDTREFRGLLPVARQDMAAFLHRLNALSGGGSQVVTSEIPL